MKKYALLLAASLLFASPLAAETLVLGTVNDNVRKQIERFEPLAAHLEEQLADFGILEVEVRILPSSQEMADAMADGQVDLYFDSPLVAAKVMKESGGVPFLRRWKRGVAEYHSVILVHADSDIETVDDLVGRRIAFQDPDSTSGYMLPADLIAREGLDLVELQDAGQAPDGTSVGYVFTGDDKNSLLSLHKGLVDAVGTDPRAQQMLEDASPGVYRAIARSIDVPRQVVIHGRDVDAELLGEINSVLVGLHHTPEGRAILAKFHETTKFDAFPEGAEATFVPILELLARMQERRQF